MQDEPSIFASKNRLEGSLAETPLRALLEPCRRHLVTGTIRVDCHDGRGVLHLRAGVVDQASFGLLVGDAAVVRMSLLRDGMYHVEQRVPDLNGELGTAAALESQTSQVPLAHVMRHCEQNALSGTITVIAGFDRAELRYRAGELVEVAMNGLPDVESLPRIVKWSDARYRLMLEPLSADIAGWPKVSREPTVPFKLEAVPLPPRRMAEGTGRSALVDGLPRLAPGVVPQAAAPVLAKGTMPPPAAPAPRASSPSEVPSASSTTSVATSPTTSAQRPAPATTITTNTAQAARPAPATSPTPSPATSPTLSAPRPAPTPSAARPPAPATAAAATASAAAAEAPTPTTSATRRLGATPESLTSSAVSTLRDTGRYPKEFALQPSAPGPQATPIQPLPPAPAKLFSTTTSSPITLRRDDVVTPPMGLAVPPPIPADAAPRRRARTVPPGPPPRRAGTVPPAAPKALASGPAAGAATVSRAIATPAPAAVTAAMSAGAAALSAGAASASRAVPRRAQTVPPVPPPSRKGAAASATTQAAVATKRPTPPPMPMITPAPGPRPGTVPPELEHPLAVTAAAAPPRARSVEPFGVPALTDVATAPTPPMPVGKRAGTIRPDFTAATTSRSGRLATGSELLAPRASSRSESEGDLWAEPYKKPKRRRFPSLAELTLPGGDPLIDGPVPKISSGSAFTITFVILLLLGGAMLAVGLGIAQ
jgi:hypothetical protein